MANPPEHWSFSSLNLLLNICPLQWRFKYVDKLEMESKSACLFFGTAFHAGASELALNRQKTSLHAITDPAAVFVQSLTESAFHDRYEAISKEELPSYIEQGSRMLQVLTDNWPKEEVLSVSERFSVDLPHSRIPLVGELDLTVCGSDGNTIVVDWKTSASKWPIDKADKDLQATLYCYAMEQRGHRSPFFRYDVITKGKTPTYTQHLTRRSPNDYARMLKFIETAERMVENNLFYPCEQSFSCSNCAYSNACRHWHNLNPI